MFGHHMQMAAHSNGFGSSFGQGSRGGFSGKRGGFGQSVGGGSFGRSSEIRTDPHSLYMEAHNNPEFMHSNHGFVRQNSLLSEMTQSKSERDKRPWGVPGYGYMNQEGGMMPYNIYDKPLEKAAKPNLERQNTCPAPGFGNTETKRAPSFKSNPDKMRSKTISSTSLPSSSPRRLTRSISINEDITEPANMDIAGPILRRQQSLEAEKAIRRSNNAPKKSKLPFTFGRRRKSVKSTSDTESMPDTMSVSIPGTPRSRTHTMDSKDSAITTDSSKSKTESVDKNHENLILSLINPEVPDNIESGYEEQTSPSQEDDAFHHNSPLESPSLVSKRVQELLHLPADHGVPEPTVVPQGTPTEGSPRLSAARLSPALNSKHVPKELSVCLEVTDSDISDTYYDCDQNTPSPANSSQRKKRSARRKRPDNSTDGEETASSACDTPPRKVAGPIPARLYPDTKSLLEPEAENPSYEDAATLKVRGNPTQAKQPVQQSVDRKKPTLAMLSGNRFSKTMHVPENDEIIEPILVNKVSAEPQAKDNFPDPCTEESSESGYATSHRQSTPRDYHQKVSDFVNSLPNKPVTVNRHVGKENRVLNGSISDIDIEDDHDGHEVYPKNKLDFTEVSCVSGSDTESDGEISVSKLEVMKLLESPTDVRARVSDEMNRKKDNNEFNGKLPSPTYLFKKENEKVKTEPIQRSISETADKSEQTDIPEKPAAKHVEVNCVVVSHEDSDKEEKTEPKGHKLSSKSYTSYNGTRSKKFSFARQLSSMYQSNSTSCVDLILHFFNFLLFVTSGAIIGLSLWLLLKDFNVNDVTVILGNDLLKIIIYVSISGSGLAMLAAFCLCCGMRQDKVGLGFYAIILVVVICAFATSAVLATIFSDKLYGIEFKFHFKDRLETMYGTALNEECEDLTKAWDLMQSHFECCGAEGNTTDSWALYQKTQWFENFEKKVIFVPESCCKRNSNTEVCQGGDHQLYGPPRFGPNFPSSHMPNPHLSLEGCYKYFASYLKILTLYIAITVGSLAGLYSLIVMLTWVFCFKKQKDYKYYNDSYTDDDETDDVFEESVNHSKNHSENIDETSFFSKRHNSHSIMREQVENVRKSRQNNKHYVMHNSNKYGDDDSEDDDSDGDDSASRSSVKSQEEVIARRNMWLSSGATSGHLLSTAIEEEDSDEEDNDNYIPRPKQYKQYK